MNVNKFLSDIDHWCCVTLLVLFLIFMISGYMITKGFISRFWGLLLHTELDLPIMLLFAFHISVQLRTYLIRLRRGNAILVNLIPLLLGLMLFLFIIYLDLFFSL